MANRLVVLHKEFGPLLNALGKKLAPSGKKSILDMKDAHRIEFGLAVTDNKKFKRLKDDRLLKKLMKNKTDSDFKKTLKKIAKIVDNETKAFHISTEAVSPGDWGPMKKTHSSNVWKQTQKELVSFSKKANATWNVTLEKYYDERQEGKHEKSKERVNKVKGVAGAAVSLAGTGVATAGTIATFGAAAPGLAAASYGSYLACKDAFDLFRKSGKSIDARRDSIFKQVAVIEKDYLGAKNKKAMQDAMKKREIKAKAMRTFLSVNSKTSLKKLGGDLAALEKALKMSKFSLSKVGRKSGEHVNRLDKVIEYCTKIEKSSLASEIKTVAKA